MLDVRDVILLVLVTAVLIVKVAVLNCAAVAVIYYVLVDVMILLQVGVLLVERLVLAHVTDVPIVATDVLAIVLVVEKVVLGA